MAEVVAGAVVAEEVVSTSIQGAVATYAVAKPTMPVKATFKQISFTGDETAKQSLARSNHTVSIINDKIYIFGGENSGNELVNNDVYCADLSTLQDPHINVISASPDTPSSPLPAPRTKHAACAFNVCIAIFGGSTPSGELVDTDATIWLFNTAKSSWESLAATNPNIAPSQRTSASLFNYDNNLILYGGTDANGHALKDVWHFSYSTLTWTPLPSAPVSTTNAALAGRSLYLISASDHMSSELHTLSLSDIPSSSFSAQWSSLSFPTNPLAPGPRPRIGGGLVPVTTGYGRNFLLYFFGARQDPTTEQTKSPDETTEPTQWGDIWTLQIPSSELLDVKPTLSGISEAMKPAKIKDAIRERLGYDSGKHSWAEAEVVPLLEDLGDGDGKVHPGPRGWFGCDVLGDGARVVFWGGENAKGEREGDGWIVTLS